MGALKAYNTSRRKDRRKKITKHIIWIVVGILVFLAGIILLLRQDFLRIKSFSLQTTQTLDENAINEHIQEFLNTSRFLLIPGNSAILFSKEHLEENLRNTFPDINTLVIEHDEITTITIAATERTPSFLWCTHDENNLPPRERIGSCYYVDENGYIYRKAPYFSEGVYFTFFTEQPMGTEGPLGQYVTAEDEFDRIKNLVTRLYDDGIIGYKIKSHEGDYALFIERIRGYGVGRDAQIYFDAENSIDEIIEHLDLTFAVDDFVEQLDEHPENLHYVDVRFKNKVIYKFSEVTSEE